MMLGEESSPRSAELAPCQLTPCTVGYPDAKDQLEERLRRQALIRYLRPAGFDHQAVQSSTKDPRPPTLSSSIQLTALAQLGSLKLDCDRAFISLIDQDVQYIVAEATRSISLRQSTRHSTPQDALFLGVQALDKSYGVCPNTISVFTDVQNKSKINTSLVQADLTRYIISDFRALDDFREKPYVASFPHMRSYLEVPLKTLHGSVVGSYCVVDTKLRPDFDDNAVFVMSEIADAISDYLDTMIVTHSQERGGRLLEGLRTFTPGNQSEKGADTAFGPFVSTTGARCFTTSFSELDPVSPLEESRERTHEPGLTDTTCTDSSTDTSPSGAMSTATTTPLDTSTDPLQDIDKDLYTKEDDIPLPEPIDILAAFAKATELIRSAMEMDGMIMIDCGLNKLERRRSSASDATTHDNIYSAGTDQNALIHPGSSTQSELLGYSLRPKSKPPTENLSLPEALFKSLIRLFPQGHVFEYDEWGPLSPGINDSSHAEGTSQREVQSKLGRRFPNQHSLVFLPLWDFQNQRWVAGMLGWTSDTTRNFEKEDLTCLSAFGNALMVELARLEALKISHAKSGFISSISHELRSPLHGILASAELLKETHDDASRASLVDIIERCGGTLLDTMTHLLEFAKINHLSKEGSNPSHSSDALVRSMDLGEVIQDVVQEVYLGQTSSSSLSHELNQEFGTNSGPRPADERVHVIIDIEHTVNWKFPFNVGAWKRIIMNLFANSLKYTLRGLIKISLRRISRKTPNGVERDHVCFAIQDTGIGMSRDYMKHQLFTPFAQENPLVMGTGLGLSIVNQIVSSLGGIIDIESKSGSGTCVTISVPLPEDVTPTSIPQNSQNTGGNLKGLTVCMFEPTTQTNSGNCEQDAVTSLITKVAIEQLNMKIIKARTLSDVLPEADICIGHLSDMQKLASLPTRNPAADTETRPDCVLMSYSPEKSGNMAKLSSAEQSIVHLGSPIGPKAIANAFQKGLKKRVDAKKSLDVATANIVTGTACTGNTASITNRNVSEPSKRSQPSQDDNVSERLPTKSQSGLRLLLVDDNAVNLKVLSTYIKKLGHEYVTASDGLEAFKQYKASGPFDVVFMDLSMPVMDGFESTRQIRSFEQQQREQATLEKVSRIIALTGVGSDEAQREARESGIDEFRIKPVSLKVLREILQPKS